jgi:cytochrome c biogenesis protein CcmG/thiol:disulfide interchange protein DsbE
LDQDEGAPRTGAGGCRDYRDDRADDSVRKMELSDRDYVAADRDRILLDAYAALHEVDHIAAVALALAKLEPDEPFVKAEILDLRGRAAELQGHALDALIFYRDAAARGATFARGIPGEAPSAAVDRLWKQLGGTAESIALFKRAIEVATMVRSWERAQNPMPSFALDDIEGRKWRSEDLVGKAVLVNVWATWCGPCRAEHAEFQKLYDRLKSRSDVVVLTFNVDTDPEAVESYLHENKYTFPVLLAGDLVHSVEPSLSIPLNWVINPKGALDWKLVGYGPSAQWQDQMIAKLEEVLQHP